MSTRKDSASVSKEERSTAASLIVDKKITRADELKKENLTRPPSEENSKPVVLLYAGIALYVAWFYSMWFVPSLYSSLPLLSWGITAGWLAFIGASAFSAFLIPLAIKESTNLVSSDFLSGAAPLAASILSLAFVYSVVYSTHLSVVISIAVALGVVVLVHWICWGEYYSTIKASFPINQIVQPVAVCALFSILLAYILPSPLNIIFVSGLPLVSGIMLMKIRKAAGDQLQFGQLQPCNDRSRALQSMLSTGCLIMLTTAGCYYVLAIIPESDLYFGDETFTYCALIASVVLLAMGLYAVARQKRLNIFRLLPLLVASAAISLIFFLPGLKSLYSIAFFIALTIVLISELLLTIYFGILASGRFVDATIAFGFSSGFIMLGIFIGNGIAVIYEHNDQLFTSLTLPTAIFFGCVLVLAVIPVVRREYDIYEIIEPIRNFAELNEQINQVAKEFDLTPRETEVLEFLVKGYSADKIGDKLFISKYTVQTHIQHIYSKTDIRKKSDLIDYVTKHVSPIEAERKQEILKDPLPDYWPFSS